MSRVGLVTSLLVITAAIVPACGGKLQGDVDAGVSDGSLTGKCCPPSPQPSCCMSFGGWADTPGACGTVCDGMPNPNVPGWHLSTDSHGCSAWVAPTSGPSCGAPPPPPPPPDASVGCQPADVSAFTPAALHPFYNHAGLCTSQQIGAYYAACLDSVTYSATACKTFATQNPSCESCLVTSLTAPTFGPLLLHSNVVLWLDIPGCMAIVSGDTSTQSCAQREDDLDQCEIAACDGVCPVTDTATFQAYAQCTEAAASGGCKKFAATACALDGGVYTTCMVSDFQSGFQTFAPMFCGP